MDRIVQCQSCGEYKHVSHFSVGERGCMECVRLKKVIRPVEIKAQNSRMSEHIRRAVKAIMSEWVSNDTMPEEITAGERQVIRRRALDMVSQSVIAREMGISEKRVRAIEQRAQAKLLRLAKEHAPLWLLSSKDAAA